MIKRILIVEDQKDNADAIADFIQFVFPDWVMERCATGQEAVDMTLKNPADVMILDIALADSVNGLEVIKRLWENGVRDKPKVVVITALGNRAFRGPRPGRPWVEQLNEQEKTLVFAFYEKPYGWHAFLTSLAKAANVEPPENLKLIPENE